MKLIHPVNQIVAADIEETNVVSTAVDLWNSGTAYVVGNRARRDGSVNKVFESIQNGTNKVPENEPTFWIEVSATNRFKPFDNRIGDTATASGLTIFYRLLAASEVSALALFGVSAGVATVRVIDTNVGRRNSALYSEEINQHVGTSVTLATGSAIDPLGTFTADPMIESVSASTNHFMRVDATRSYTSGTSYTFSVYVRQQVGTRNVRLRFPGTAFTDVGDGSGQGPYCSFNPDTGEILQQVGGGVATAIRAPNNYWRVSLTATASSSVTDDIGFIYMMNGTTTAYVGNGVSSVLLWGLQSNQTSNNAGRINLLLATDAINVSPWSLSGATVSTNVTANPIDGDVTADKLVENSANSQHSVGQNVSSLANTVYTMSAYVRVAGRSRCSLTARNTANWAITGNTNFDLSGGGSVTSGPGKIEALPDGWFRISTTGTFGASDASGGLNIGILDNSGNAVYTGNSTDGILIYGAQIEASPTLSELQTVGAVYVSEYQWIKTSSVFGDRVYNRTIVLNARTPNFDTESVFLDMPAQTGDYIEVFVQATTSPELGEIVMGRLVSLGHTVEPTSVGIIDYSSKERDVFGNVNLIVREFAQTASYTFTHPTTDTRRIQRELAMVRATPAVYLYEQDLTNLGLTIYGIMREFNIPLSGGGLSFATLEVEGLV